MLNNIELTGIHTEITKKIKTHVEQKFGIIDKYIPKKSRNGAQLEIVLSESKVKEKNERFECEAKLALPHQTIVVKESSQNFFTAIDIVDAKLKVSIDKYKQQHIDPKHIRHMTARLAG
jgi:ribosomal subunit interface protein